MRFVLVICLLAACGEDLDAPRSPVGAVPESEQRTGDAREGWRALIEEGYVGCGLPLSAYKRVFPEPAPEAVRLDRAGPSADLPYNLTAFRTASGVDVVTPNCLQCHAQQLGDQIVFGLGSHTADYTTDLDSLADLAGSLVEDPTELAEFERWRGRIASVAPYTITKTIGVNPADNLAAVLFAHRDRDTLAWSDEPLMELPPMITVPVDVPPWWHMQKKHAMFYVGAGRGDHARIMMTASTLCVDTVEEARAIDSYFPDVRSFLLSIEPPRWPHPIDTARADTGRGVFEANCARCHGTYGDGGEYPNLIVATAEVGTDDVMARGAGQFADIYLDWYNTSFFGELSNLAPAPGYIAPPLDGIWATAPYLHNGSIPTLRALLDSSTRPRFFVRSFNPYDYNTAAVGWNFKSLETGHEQRHPEFPSNEIYDTTELGYGNGGHTFGDTLTADERDAVIEYLKTL
jgi:mono/diheme cytochrome c family protein